MTVAATEETAPTTVADDPTPGEPEAPSALVEEGLLVEDVSIDGMCGVY
jgi:mycofactocin precursor